MLDFDGVLLDDERFKKDYTLVFKRFGISKAAYQSTYHAAKIKTGGYYAPDVHLAILQKQYPRLHKEELARAISMFVKMSFRYVYPDAEEFLSYFKMQKVPLFLVSTGHSFQREKIKASKLTPFFKQVFVVKSVSKKEPLARVVGHGDRAFIFIDDKKEIADKVKKEFPQAMVIQMRRRRTVSKSAHADAVVKNMSEAKTLCEKILRQKS